MNFIGRLRRLRWLKRATLVAIALASLQSTLLPCAMAAQMDSGFAKHCVYCPGDMQNSGRDSQVNNGCNFVHAPSVDGSSYAHHLAALHDSPPLVGMPRAPQMETRQFSISIKPSHQPPHRPLTLTHCVQLK